ncbi:MAG: electron transfer flavoprotein subunit alpha/FixB family protein [Candidatus Bathyarchaeia archaeon]
MNEIFVLAEHRQGQLRDITFEMLTKGKQLAENTNANLTAILLGKNVMDIAKALTEYADKVVVVEDDRLEYFISSDYQRVMEYLIKCYQPILTLIGHTSYGVELAPRLAVSLGIPLATDCINLEFEDGKLKVTRQIYGGKINAILKVRQSRSYIVTVRPATFKAQKPSPPKNGQIIKERVSLEEAQTKRFIEYVSPPPGAVDISGAKIVVGIGRGIKEQNNIPMIEELANLLGGVIGCSRPIVDKGWLPYDRQIGVSGKTIKPKLYLALGISGAFQHVVGMKSSELVISVNKDQNAPIFGYSDYAIVEDLFKIVPALKKVLAEAKVKK